MQDDIMQKNFDKYITVEKIDARMRFMWLAEQFILQHKGPGPLKIKWQ